jgi:alanyl-tRNA synthetase
MSTPRLHHDDPLLLSFQAIVAAHGQHGGSPSILLDRTAFYPESGGQMADRGTLGGARVIDVQVDDAGLVHHLIEGELPAVGAAVSGAIDRERRRLHMALHTAQHMLSRALVDIAGAETVSARLGETACTVDVEVTKGSGSESGSGATLSERHLAEAEDLVNSLIDDDLSVRAFFPSPDELRALPLRRAPKVTDRVRVVDIGGFDVSPCGGTHCTHTAQVGLLHISGIERYKGKIRVTFNAGRRARRELSTSGEALRAVARELTCGPSDVGGAVDKLRRELAENKDAAKRYSARLAEACAGELLTRAAATDSPHVIGAFEDVSVDFLRTVGARVTAERSAGAAFIAARAEGGTSVLVARGASSTFDCGAFLKRAAAASGGRGGGKPDRAEGRLPAEVDWPALVNDLLRG